MYCDLTDYLSISAALVLSRLICYYHHLMKVPIDKVAKLCNINLKPEEERSLSSELDKILAHVEKINSIEGLEKVNPTSHPFDSENVYRKDKVISQDTARNVLEHAPEREGNFFKVPKVIEQ